MVTPWSGAMAAGRELTGSGKVAHSVTPAGRLQGVDVR